MSGEGAQVSHHSTSSNSQPSHIIWSKEGNMGGCMNAMSRINKPIREREGNMAVEEGADHYCVFDILFSKNVPHVLERIFLSIDYESYKACCQVSKYWNGLLTSEDFVRKGRSVFHQAILDDERRLIISIQEGDTRGVRRLLLTKMLNVYCTLPTSLHMAVRAGHNDMVKLLIDAGADPKKEDVHNFNQTPVHMAAKQGHTDVVKLLIDAGADPSKEDCLHQTPLSLAAAWGHTDVVKLLIDNMGDKWKETPLHFLHMVARVGHADVAGAHSCNHAHAGLICKMRYDPTPLHLAAARGHADVVKLLIDAGADLNKGDMHNNTPLHLAAARGHADVVKLLIDAGADLSKRNMRNKTPLQKAKKGHAEVVKLLIDAITDPNKEDLDNQTPLHRAAEEGHTDVAKL